MVRTAHFGSRARSTRASGAAGKVLASVSDTQVAALVPACFANTHRFSPQPARLNTRWSLYRGPSRTREDYGFVDSWDIGTNPSPPSPPTTPPVLTLCDDKTSAVEVVRGYRSYSRLLSQENQRKMGSHEEKANVTAVLLQIINPATPSLSNRRRKKRAASTTHKAAIRDCFVIVS